MRKGVEDPYSPRYCNCQRGSCTTVSGWEGRTKDEARVRTLIIIDILRWEEQD